MPTAAVSIRPSQPFKVFQRKHCPYVNGLIVEAADTGNVGRLLDVISTHLQDMNLVNLTTSLHRLAKLSGDNPELLASLHSEGGVGGEVLIRLVARVHQALLKCTSGLQESRVQSVSNISWSLATLQYLDVDVVRLIYSLSLEKLGLFKPLELSSLVWAFAKLSPMHPEIKEMSTALIQASFEPLRAGTDEMSFCSMTMVVWALAYMSAWKLPASWVLKQQMTRRLLTSLQGNPPIRPRQMIDLAWTFAQPDCRNDQILAEVSKRALGCLRSFSPEELVELRQLFGLTQGMMSTEASPAPLASAVARLLHDGLVAALGCVTNMTPDTIVQILVSLAAQGIQDMKTPSSGYRVAGSVEGRWNQPLGTGCQQPQQQRPPQHDFVLPPRQPQQWPSQTLQEFHSRTATDDRQQGPYCPPRSQWQSRNQSTAQEVPQRQPQQQPWHPQSQSQKEQPQSWQQRARIETQQDEDIERDSVASSESDDLHSRKVIIGPTCGKFSTKLKEELQSKSIDDGENIVEKMPLTSSDSQLSLRDVMHLGCTRERTHPLSFGSVRHLCQGSSQNACRPCLFERFPGRCRRGLICDFCHMHTERGTTTSTGRGKRRASATTLPEEMEVESGTISVEGDSHQWHREGHSQVQAQSNLSESRGKLEGHKEENETEEAEEAEAEGATKNSDCSGSSGAANHGCQQNSSTSNPDDAGSGGDGSGSGGSRTTGSGERSGGSGSGGDGSLVKDRKASGNRQAGSDGSTSSGGGGGPEGGTSSTSYNGSNKTAKTGYHHRANRVAHAVWVSRHSGSNNNNSASNGNSNHSSNNLSSSGTAEWPRWQ